jgi:hypothetical protein
MVMLGSLFGLVFFILGVFTYRRGQKTVGGILIFIGGLLVVLGVIALLSFHP